MSRSGYSEDIENWSLIRWRGAVSSAIRGRRGQAFLRELLDALDALPTKRLIAENIVRESDVCAIGAVGLRRGVDMTGLDPEDYAQVAATFGIPNALARELFYENDEVSCHIFEEPYGPPNRWIGAGWIPREATPEERFTRIRAWVVAHLREPAA